MKVKEYMLVFCIIKVSDYATNAVVRTKTIDMTLGKQRPGADTSIIT
jgi:hypothetical protein